ncbi:sulfotransferase family protein [Aquibium sp. ELW1220]|uniref:sulfotransferase family protein n=1 Tax=Aquibium sp. ELW1220 TaxID=2976766 RepID=UPI0025B0B12C|nr:sulfotransferase family protein [Aquibium sp. ELW1220]MDN2584211.1 hypothetical protein [Aquibium sp. ELW1220]
MDEREEAGPDEAVRENLLSQGRYAEAVEAFRSASLEHAVLLGRRLASHNAIAEARTLYRNLWERPKRPFEWFQLRVLIPLVFHEDERQRKYISYREVVEAQLPAIKHPGGRTNLVQALLCADLALQDYDAFRQRAEPFRGAEGLPPFLARLVALLPRIEEPADVADRREKVFVIGLSKTGTKSITQGLEMMGYTTAHWSNPFTRALIDEEDFALFDCCSDTPVSFRFEELAERFPNARFINTGRPAESWVASFRNHFVRHHGVSDLEAVRRRFHPRGPLFHGPLYARINDRLYTRYGSLEEAYHAHGERVRGFFAGTARDRLLEFDLFRGDGWAELSRFVGRPAPHEPFPWIGRAPGREAPATG